MKKTKDFKEKVKKVGRVITNIGVAPIDKIQEHNLTVYITDRFVAKCKKGKVWNTPALFSTLGNCEYGFDVQKMKSPGGKDGIFSIDRNYTPKNEMQKKIFDQFLDKDHPLLKTICGISKRNAAEAKAVRVVSHHMRLLGVLFVADDIVDSHQLFLVDYDDTKE